MAYMDLGDKTGAQVLGGVSSAYGSLGLGRYKEEYNSLLVLRVCYFQHAVQLFAGSRSGVCGLAKHLGKSSIVRRTSHQLVNKSNFALPVLLENTSRLPRVGSHDLFGDLRRATRFTLFFFDCLYQEICRSLLFVRSSFRL